MAAFIPRQSIPEMFSTFIQLDADRFSSWVTDPKLRRSMQKCLDAAGDEGSENFWAIYWHRSWSNGEKPLAKMHLWSYIQESAYWSAQEMLRKMVGVELLTDCFQVVNAGTETVLRRFDSSKGFKFKSFAGVVFLNVLREWLRKKSEANGCTVWGLLRRVSKRKLCEALARENLSLEQISQFHLAWKCFRELYVPQQIGRTDRLSEPDMALWEEVAALYNRERLGLAVPGAVCTGAIAKAWMVKVEAIVRRYLSPRVDSLEPFPGDEDGGTRDVPDGELSPIDWQIARETDREMGERLKQQDELLLSVLRQFDGEEQRIMELLYKQDLGQTEIARQMSAQQVISQATVSRRIKKCRGSLLGALVDWRQRVLGSKGEVNKDLSPDQVKDATAALEVWLKTRYKLNEQLNA
jgi:RNA polymerase sigma factor (sigma-70 family)